MQQEITELNFEKLVLQSEIPVLVDCRAEGDKDENSTGPILEVLSKEFEGRALVGRCDIEKNPGIPQVAGVLKIPMLLYFKDGKLVDRHMGSASKAVLAARLIAQL